jgi:hypothetical protein
MVSMQANSESIKGETQAFMMLVPRVECAIRDRMDFARVNCMHLP